MPFELQYMLALSCDCSSCKENESPKTEIFEGSDRDEAFNSAEETGWRLEHYSNSSRHKSHLRSAKHLMEALDRESKSNSYNE